MGLMDGVLGGLCWARWPPLLTVFSKDTAAFRELPTSCNNRLGRDGQILGR